MPRNCGTETFLDCRGRFLKPICINVSGSGLESTGELATLSAQPIYIVRTCSVPEVHRNAEAALFLVGCFCIYTGAPWTDLTKPCTISSSAPSPQRKQFPSPPVPNPVRINMTRANELLGIFYAALGSFTFGYALSVGSTIIGLQGFINYYDIDTTGPNAAYANRIQGGERRWCAGGSGRRLKSTQHSTVSFSLAALSVPSAKVSWPTSLDAGELCRYPAQS
jgi:hypothetical protein